MVLLPQHSPVASVFFTAHVMSSPEEMWEYAVPIGALHSPSSFLPKHSAYPVILRVQVCCWPALIADFSPAGTLDRPSTATPQQIPVRSSFSPHE